MRSRGGRWCCRSWAAWALWSLSIHFVTFPVQGATGCDFPFLHGFGDKPWMLEPSAYMGCWSAAHGFAVEGKPRCGIYGFGSLASGPAAGPPPWPWQLLGRPRDWALPIWEEPLADSNLGTFLGMFPPRAIV